MWGGPNGQGLVHIVKANTEQIGTLIESQKSTQETVAALVAQTAEMQREHQEHREQAKLERMADQKRIASLESARARILTGFAIIGALTVLPASVLTLISHAASLGIHF